MNEKIKDLAVKAGMNHMGIGLIIGIEEYHQKFAELIIKECVNKIGDEHKKVLDDIMEDWDRGYLAGLSTSMETIKQNFGVEL